VKVHPVVGIRRLLVNKQRVPDEFDLVIGNRRPLGKEWRLSSIFDCLSSIYLSTVVTQYDYLASMTSARQTELRERKTSGYTS
jgi:hypothetical protein